MSGDALKIELPITMPTIRLTASHTLNVGRSAVCNGGVNVRHPPTERAMDTDPPGQLQQHILEHAGNVRSARVFYGAFFSTGLFAAPFSVSRTDFKYAE
jgi:hypothetical protein